jgi:hypothetical protein
MLRIMRMIAKAQRQHLVQTMKTSRCRQKKTQCRIYPRLSTFGKNLNPHPPKSRRLASPHTTPF